MKSVNEGDFGPCRGRFLRPAVCRPCRRQDHRRSRGRTSLRSTERGLRRAPCSTDRGIRELRQNARIVCSTMAVTAVGMGTAPCAGLRPRCVRSLARGNGLSGSLHVAAVLSPAKCHVFIWQIRPGRWRTNERGQVLYRVSAVASVG